MIDEALQTALGSLVSGRCYPMQRPQNAAVPVIVYLVVSDEPQNTLCGTGTLFNARVQIDAWATTYAAARTLADQIAAAMAVSAMPNVLISRRPEPDEAEDIKRWVLEFSIWHN
jgi:hypothetical protein